MDITLDSAVVERRIIPDLDATAQRSLRRAKIVCTLGPATATDERTRTLVETGMDIARLNFSHGDHTDHEANYRRVRAAADSTGRAVGILADLQGPKIRLGRFTDGATVWAAVEHQSTTVPALTHTPRTHGGVISFAARRDIGERLNATALVAFTQSGDTVRRLARLHTPLPLLAFTPVPQVRNELALTWGTETFLVDRSNRPTR